METSEFTKNVIDWIEEKGGKEITVIDLKNFESALADNFIIASGSSDRQVKAIVENIEEKAEKEGVELRSIEGENSLKWTLLDYYDTIIHIFHESTRHFYDLERLFKDGGNITNV